MIIIGLLFVVAGVFQITGACEENHGYEDQSLAFRNIQQRIDPYDPYRYANTPFLIPYYYNYPPSSRIPVSSGNILNILNWFEN